jgi:hypothetical protein
LRDDLRRFLDGHPTLARPLSVGERLIRWADRNRLIATLISLLTLAILVVFLQLATNLKQDREQNRILQESNKLLRTEKQLSDTLREQAQLNRSRAEQRESDYRTLAWNGSIRECLVSLQRKQYFSAWQSLESLRQTQPENIDRLEWQLASHELRHNYETVFNAGHRVDELVIIPGTSMLAVAGKSRRIDIIDSQTFERTGSVLTEIQEIHALAVSADGKRIAVGGSINEDNQSVPMIYSLNDGRFLQSLTPQATTIESLQFSPDGKYLVCGSRYQPV